jgi:serine/threonine-protein kinase RsbT
VPPEKQIFAHLRTYSVGVASFGGQVGPNDRISATIGRKSLVTKYDVVGCRQLVGDLAKGLGFSLIGRTMLVTAASELARNTVTYGGGGVLEWEIVVREPSRVGLRLTFEDCGPGISDIALAMRDGWTSGTGLGLGLSGAKRLVHEFSIRSSPGAGTRVVITRWK